MSIQGDPNLDRFSGKGKTPNGDDLRATVSFIRENGNGVAIKGQNADRHIWGKGDGWFSASYGPFRRFTGGDPESRRLFYQFPRLGRHLSLFGEEVALTECLEWLRELRFKQLEQVPEGALLDRIKAFVNQEGFLPFKARLEDVSSSAVHFTDGNGATVEVENLSDGYRSILSMTFELIRQLATVYGANAVFDPNDAMTVSAPGVVLIDEIDAHFHPTWQRRIGFWFREHFPRMQFIVSSHSPLVCQAADPGTIFRLPRPGYDEDGYMVSGDEYRRLVFGNVLDAYGTEVFGEGVTSSDRSPGPPRTARRAKRQRDPRRFDCERAERAGNAPPNATDRCRVPGGRSCSKSVTAHWQPQRSWASPDSRPRSTSLEHSIFVCRRGSTLQGTQP